MRLTALVLLCCAVPVSSANESQAAQLFPSGTLFYAEIPDPPGLLFMILDHPLFEKIEALPQYRQAVTSQDYRNFLTGRRMVEIQLGMDWREALETLTAQGIAVGFDPRTQGVGVVIRGRDAESVDRLVTKLVDIVRVGGSRRAVEETEYRGITVHQIDQAFFATIEDRLVVVNKPRLGQSIVDGLLDEGNSSLADNPRFQSAAAQSNSAATVRAFADVSAIRESGAAEDLFRGRAEDNPVAELLVGGILSTLQNTPWASAELTVVADSLSLKTSMPHETEWIPEEREYFFGPRGSGRGPRLPGVDATVFTLSTWRDVSEMWLRAGDLFNQSTVDGFAEADAGLTTFFAGRDFGEDILGALSPEIGFIAARQDFSDILPQPTIRLPSFALVLRLEDPKIMTRELRRAFQSTIGFVNVLGAMEGRLQLELDMETLDDGVQLVTATYIPEEDESESTSADIIFNFSPSVGFSGDRFVVSSTRELAHQLITAADSEPRVTSDNSRVSVDVAVLRDILNDNRDQLVSQNMLSEGQSRDEAEAAIDLLLEIADYVRDAAVRMVTNDNVVELELSLGLAE